jgi:hypothetical protein
MGNPSKKLSKKGNIVGARLQAFGRFLYRHWAFTSAVILALLVTVAVIGLIIAFPSSLFAIAFIPILSTTPFAFLAKLTFPAAVATVAAFTFFANIYISAVFNVLVISYNSIDEWISRLSAAAGKRFSKPELHIKTSGAERNDGASRPTWWYDGARVQRYDPNSTNTDIREEVESLEIESSDTSVSAEDPPVSSDIPPSQTAVTPAISSVSPTLTPPPPSLDSFSQTAEDQDPSMGYGKPFHSILPQNVKSTHSKNFPTPSYSDFPIIKTVTSDGGVIRTESRRATSREFRSKSLDSSKVVRRAHSVEPAVVTDQDNINVANI